MIGFQEVKAKTLESPKGSLKFSLEHSLKLNINFIAFTQVLKKFHNPVKCNVCFWIGIKMEISVAWATATVRYITTIMLIGTAFNFNSTLHPALKKQIPVFVSLTFSEQTYLRLASLFHLGGIL